jgi:hypothetical protein
MSHVSTCVTDKVLKRGQHWDKQLAKLRHSIFWETRVGTSTHPVRGCCPSSVSLTVSRFLPCVDTNFLTSDLPKATCILVLPNLHDGRFRGAKKQGQVLT